MNEAETALPPEEWGRIPDAQMLDGNMRALFCLWDAKSSDDLPLRSAFSVHELAPFLPNMVMLDPGDTSPDFRFTYMGTEVVKRSIEDRTGQYLRDVPAMAPGTRFWQRFEWSLIHRSPLYSEVEYVGGDAGIRHVQDILLPTRASDGSVVSFFIYVHYVGFVAPR